MCRSTFSSTSGTRTRSNVRYDTTCGHCGYCGTCGRKVSPGSACCEKTSASASQAEAEMNKTLANHSCVDGDSVGTYEYRPNEIGKDPRRGERLNVTYTDGNAQALAGDGVALAMAEDGGRAVAISGEPEKIKAALKRSENGTMSISYGA